LGPRKRGQFFTQPLALSLQIDHVGQRFGTECFPVERFDKNLPVPCDLLLLMLDLLQAPFLKLLEAGLNKKQTFEFFYAVLHGFTHLSANR